MLNLQIIELIDLSHWPFKFPLSELLSFCVLILPAITVETENKVTVTAALWSCGLGHLRLEEAFKRSGTLIVQGQEREG